MPAGRALLLVARRLHLHGNTKHLADDDHRNAGRSGFGSEIAAAAPEEEREAEAYEMQGNEQRAGDEEHLLPYEVVDWLELARWHLSLLARP